MNCGPIHKLHRRRGAAYRNRTAIVRDRRIAKLQDAACGGLEQPLIRQSVGIDGQGSGGIRINRSLIDHCQSVVANLSGSLNYIARVCQHCAAATISVNNGLARSRDKRHRTRSGQAHRAIDAQECRVGNRVDLNRCCVVNGAQQNGRAVVGDGEGASIGYNSRRGRPVEGHRSAGRNSEDTTVERCERPALNCDAVRELHGRGGPIHFDRPRRVVDRSVGDLQDAAGDCLHQTLIRESRGIHGQGARGIGKDRPHIDYRQTIVPDLPSSLDQVAGIRQYRAATTVGVNDGLRRPRYKRHRARARQSHRAIHSQKCGVADRINKNCSGVVDRAQQNGRAVVGNCEGTGIGQFSQCRAIERHRSASRNSEDTIVERCQCPALNRDAVRKLHCGRRPVYLDGTRSVIDDAVGELQSAAAGGLHQS